MKIWDLREGECVATFGAKDGGHLKANAVNSVISLDNRTVASGGADSYIKVCSLARYVNYVHFLRCNA